MADLALAYGVLQKSARFWETGQPSEVMSRRWGKQRVPRVPPLMSFPTATQNVDLGIENAEGTGGGARMPQAFRSGVGVGHRDDPHDRRQPLDVDRESLSDIGQERQAVVHLPLAAYDDLALAPAHVAKLQRHDFTARRPGRARNNSRA